ncbi:murein hydrolase activator EnvC family protein [Paludibacterium paludis]|uniref:M23ase beta-sheet core domain-containing protein n=1 Tax=Paludibacterium paludis TaxID=1225769 RepID=A0A918NWM6_9NEIS|nr:peptidoglycan DD-metalloendopeptidase family protein [Paludibacterium paludis]GGY02433.1 hypothetical protein GCM10011289_00700 [Paludibacterium paludis]
MKLPTLLTVACLFPVAACAATAGKAASDLNVAPHQQDLRSVRKEIDSLQKDIAQKEAVRKEAQSAIKESEQAISRTSQALKALEGRKTTSSAELSSLRAEIDRTRQSIAVTRQQVVRMLSKQYRNGNHDAMKLMLNAADPNQTSRDMVYYRHIVEARQQLIGDLNMHQRDLEALSAKLEEELARLDHLANRKTTEKSRLLEDKADKESTVTKLASDIQSRQDKLVRLKEDEKRLTGLIAQINREIQKRKAQEAAARKARIEAARKENERRRKLADNARKAGKPVPSEARQSVPVEKPIAADDSADARAFRGQQGALKLPVAGEITGRFGTARSEGTTWKGIFIKTTPGQPVHAVAAGRVVYADALRGFGNAVIVDHGGNYMSVYTGLGNIGRSVGDTVKAQDSLGSTGKLDNGDSGLYFEIRYLGRPVNPLTWARQ